MYAIVEIAGQQFKIEENQKIFVHRLNAEEGSKMDFDRVLLARSRLTRSTPKVIQVKNL